jgi:putative membrane protein
MTEPRRKPAIFSADDPRLAIETLDEPQRVNTAAATLPELPTGLAGTAQARRVLRMGWGAIFWSALSGLVLLGLGVAVARFVEDLFIRAPWLGALGLALALLAGLALVALIAREAMAYESHPTLGARPRAAGGPSCRHHRRPRPRQIDRTRADDPA